MRLLVTGASGQLGSYLLRALNQRDHCVTAWSGSRSDNLFGHRLRPVDLAENDALVAAYREARPEITIHAAAISTVAACYRDAERAGLVNVTGTELLAELAAESQTRLIFVSTDLVFDGEDAPYSEQASPSPLSVYGKTKVAAERLVLDVRRSVVARGSLLFGVAINGRSTFFDEQVAALRHGTKSTAFVNEWRAPLSVQAAAEGLLALAESDFDGLLHLGGPERISRFEMGQRLAAWLGSDSSAVVPGRRGDVKSAEPRPCDVTLDSSLWRARFPDAPWPTFEEALTEFDFGL